MEIKKDFSLKAYNSFGVDAKSKYFIEINTVDELKEFLKIKEYSCIPKLILGGGCNILFTKCFEGIVIKPNLKGIEIVDEKKDFTYVKAYAGEIWDDFISYCIINDFGGVENLSMIPGSVGGSPIQNIGAYGVELKDVFHELEAINIETGEIKKFNKADCKFGYRDSIFKRDLKNKYIILSVTLKLTKGKHFFITTYGNVEKELEEMNTNKLDILTISNAICNIRKRKLPDSNELGNAGSFFKNPYISYTEFEVLLKKFPSIPSFEGPGKKIKIPAGWLIEQSGWKEKRVGDVGVHEEQALVIVNYGNAKGSEIFDFAKKVQRSVFDKFRLDIEFEVNII